MRNGGEHGRFGLISHGYTTVVRCQLFVFDASRKLGVDVIVVKRSWSTQSNAEIGVEGVCAPESATPALRLDLAQPTHKFKAPVSVQTDSHGQMRHCAKETPAMIDSGLGEKIVALS